MTTATDILRGQRHTQQGNIHGAVVEQQVVTEI